MSLWDALVGASATGRNAGTPQGLAQALSTNDAAAMSSETYVNPLAQGLVGALGGAARSLGTLPKRVFDANRTMMETGTYNPEPFLEAALLPLGRTAFSAPAGAWCWASFAQTAGGRGISDGAGQRKERGFYTDMPAYHGTASEFRSFDTSKAGSMSQAKPSQQGVFSALDPETASSFAEMAANKSSGNPQVMPLFHRSEKPAVLHLKGDEMNHEVAATLADAWEKGHTSVLLRNLPRLRAKRGEISSW